MSDGLDSPTDSDDISKALFDNRYGWQHSYRVAGTIIMMETWKKHRLAFSVSLSACFFMSDVLPHWRTHPHQGGPALLAILEWTLADTAAFVMFQLCLFFVVGKIFAWGKTVWNGKRQGEF